MPGEIEKTRPRYTVDVSPLRTMISIALFQLFKGATVNRQLPFGASSHAQSIWPIMVGNGVSLKDNAVSCAIRRKLKFRRLPTRNQKNEPYNRYPGLRVAIGPLIGPPCTDDGPRDAQGFLYFLICNYK